MNTLTKNAVSVSSVANCRTLDKVLAYLAKPELEIGHIELSIGAKSPLDLSSVDLYKQYEQMVNSGITFSAHSNFAFFTHLNEHADFKSIIGLCKFLEIDKYSVHAPTKTACSDIVEWALPKIELAANEGIELSFETMYPRTNHPYWLESFAEVADFLWRISGKGIFTTILMDLAHLQICVNKKTWNTVKVTEMLKSPWVSQIHYSDNDGINDVHSPYVAGTNHLIDSWMADVPDGILKIDEGRKRHIAVDKLI